MFFIIYFSLIFVICYILFYLILFYEFPFWFLSSYVIQDSNYEEKHVKDVVHTPREKYKAHEQKFKIWPIQILHTWRPPWGLYLLRGRTTKTTIFHLPTPKTPFLPLQNLHQNPLKVHNFPIYSQPH